MIKIVTDSTCNLSPEQLQRHDIRVAPISIQFGTETYEEDIDIDRDLFYKKIDELGIIPTTSQPSPGRFADYYRELTDQGHSILSITITSKHSGTYQSAILAKDMVPEADVEVFDSATISLGTGYMVLEAARAAEAGQSRESILKRLAEIRDNMGFFFTPATLKYLRMSGRVGRLATAFASLLDIKPIIILEDGLLEARERVRTRSKAINRLLELAEEAMGTTDPINIAVIHARAPEEGQALLEKAQARFNCQETLIGDLVASLTVHGGPGTLILFAYKV
ncbi:MAG: DegV family EDD domain-containing protein [Anaerolineae bacterium]|nr:DegV family EDD domain-containing protein [Anaerolineae bacterium]